MRITILIENRSESNTIVAEKGFSAYIQLDDINILFDTAMNGGFINNARVLGIDLLQTTHIVLSHGHDDHTNGLLSLIQNDDIMSILKSKNIELITHPLSLVKKRRQTLDGDYSTISSLHDIDIGMFFKLQLSIEPYWINSNICFLGQIPKKYSFEGNYSIGEVLISDVWKQDFLIEDSALAIKSPKGLIIVTGCSHRGICNIIDYAISVTGESRIYDVIGGLHLNSANNEMILNTINCLKNYDIAELNVCHCSGDNAIKLMTKSLNIKKSISGKVIKIT